MTAAMERKPLTIWLASDETRKALVDVANERIRQDQKWGRQRHDFPVWLTVLMEEVGELAQATLSMREYAFFGNSGPERDELERMRSEAAQVAAVAVAMIEHIDEELR